MRRTTFSRGRLILAFGAALLVAAACDPLIPGPDTVVVHSVVVAPTVVMAGSPFTVTVDASDTLLMKQMWLEFVAIHWNGTGHIEVPCQAPAFAPTRAITQVFSCTMPAVAPSGHWEVWANVCDSNLTVCLRDATPGGGIAGQTFEVTGGTDDTAPPALVSAIYSPNPVIAGQPFTITATFSDEHPDPIHASPGLTYYNASHVKKLGLCPAVHTLPAPTLDQVVFTCPALAAGTYPLEFNISDQIGYQFVWQPGLIIPPAP